MFRPARCPLAFYKTADETRRTDRMKESSVRRPIDLCNAYLLFKEVANGGIHQNAKFKDGIFF